MQTKAADVQGGAVLITGAARRIGAAIARTLHEAGMNVVLHYHRSAADARGLHDELNGIRDRSAVLLQANLHEIDGFGDLISEAIRHWGRLDAVVNNASAFHPTPIGKVDRQQWDDLMDSNLRGPFFLAQSAAPALAVRNGAIVNITDIHAERPLKGYAVYSISKAGLVMMTKALARELAPSVRVNAVAPGTILWPEHGIDADTKRHILARTPFKRQGTPEEIARAVLFLIRDATYTTGQVIAVDGGRSLYS